MRIRQLGDPVLKEEASPFKLFNSETADRLIENMFETMYTNHGVGLAANQVGVLQHIFVYDDQEGNKGVLCNASLIIPTNWKTHKVKEGCLSIPGEKHYPMRYESVTLTANTIEGKDITIEADGLLGQIFQHEVDHLNGKLFISLLPKATQMAIVLGNQVM